MESLQSIKNAHAAGSLAKAAFVEAIYRRHAGLFEYPGALATTNIAEFRLRDDGVVAFFRDPPIAMYCPAGDPRSAPLEAFNFGDYERAEFRMVRRLIEALGGASTAFFDIGANAGFYSLALARDFPGIRGRAFEPIPATFALLGRNLELNGAAGVVAENLGLSDRTGEAVFHAYPNLSGASAMARNVESAESAEIRCPVQTLDDYCDATGADATFVKCDVEGGELRVLRGAQRWLARSRPVIFAEMLRKWSANYGYHPNDIIDLLANLGYACFVTRGERLDRCEAVTPDTADTNFFFLHGDRHAAFLGGFVG